MALDMNYVQELFKKAGASDEDTAVFVKTLGNEKIQKAFSEGFVATPNHHSTIDRMKGEWEGKVNEANAKVDRYNEWYQKDQIPAYQAYQQGLQKLKKYEELYGPVDDAAATRAAAQETGMTKDQVEQMLKQRDQLMGQAFTSLSKEVAWATADHAQRFKEVLDPDLVEKRMLEKNMSFKQAYLDMVAPKVEEMRTAEWEAKVTAARKEGYQDAASKAGIPVDSRPKEPHPIFDQKLAPEGMSPLQQERQSEASFLEGWNNHNAA